LEVSLERIDKSPQFRPGFWVTHGTAKIQSKIGGYPTAIETAALSREEAGPRMMRITYG